MKSKRTMMFLTGLVSTLALGWFGFPHALYKKIDQPLQFSHRVHTGEGAGMACEDCHAFAEDGRFSGIPKIAKCAECHAAQLGTTDDEKILVEQYVTPNREIPWLIYSRQPDNAYFSHVQHVKLAELKCEQCHGPHGVSEKLRPFEVNRLGGSALGLLFTPVPWKALDDLSIWTQNGPWTPKPLRGDITTKFSVCALCPAGCALRARCVGNHPVTLFGVAEHPLSHGMLCPLGFTGHHLAYHPLRAVQPLQLAHNNGAVKTVPISRDAAITEIAQAIKSTAAHEYVAVLEARPGRMISLLYRQFLAGLPNGVYLHEPARECATLETLQALLEIPFGPLGVDLENARTLLSFGAPILDGWGTPGQILHLRKNQSQLDSNQRLQIIQIETRQSRTALFADQWLPIKPGTEIAFALGLAHVIVREKLFDEKLIKQKALDFQHDDGRSYLDLVKQFDPERVANITPASVLHKLLKRHSKRRSMDRRLCLAAVIRVAGHWVKKKKSPSPV
jgi:hypothetical protein